jgi:hypothetical protein
MYKKIIFLILFVSFYNIFVLTNIAFAEACIPSNPSISIFPSNQSGSGTIFYSVNLKNNDNSYCNKTDFRLTCNSNYSYLNCVLISSGGIEASSIVDGNISPGYEWYRTAKVTTYNSTSTSYPFMITIDDGAFNNTITKSATVTAYYTVKSPIVYTTDYKTVNFDESFSISLNATNPYKWELWNYDGTSVGTSGGGGGCSPDGQCIYLFQFTALKNTKTITIIEFVKKDSENYIVEKRQIYLTIESTCRNVSDQCEFNEECCSKTCVMSRNTTIGICKATYTGESCTDSDNGRNFYKKGTTFGLTNVGLDWSKTAYINIDDICAKNTQSSTGENDTALFEYSCYNGRYYSETFFCPYGCKDGACIKSNYSVCGDGICDSSYGENSTNCPADCGNAINCTDSDNGINYFVKGCIYAVYNSSTGGGGGGACDECIGNTLTEGYCEGNQIKSVKYECPYGCKGGACLSSSEIPKTEENISADLWEVIFINETEDNQNLWRLFDINNDFYSANYLNAHEFRECDSSGKMCKAVFEFQAIKEGSAPIVLQKINGSDLSVMEEKYFYITIKERFTNAYLNKPFELNLAASNSQNRKAKILDFKSMVIELVSVGVNSAGVIVTLPEGPTPILLGLNKGESKDVFGANIKLSNISFDWSGAYPSKATFVVTLQTSDFSFNVYSNNYYNLPDNTVQIKAILSGTSNFDFQNASVEININDPNGNIIELPVEKLGTVTTECVESLSTKSYVCNPMNHYSFYSKYEVLKNSTKGLYTINAKAILGGIEKDAYSSFKVVDEKYSNLVEVSIKPKEQNAVIGEETSYEVTINDNHPLVCAMTNESSCGNSTYNYLIVVDGLPYNTVFPSVVSISAGKSKTFKVKIFPSSAKTAEGINSTVEKSSVTNESASQRAVSVTGEQIAVNPATSAPVREASFKFLVKASLEEDSTTTDSDMGILNVKFVESVEPPMFPNPEKINMDIRKGWNLISVPGKGINFVTGNCSESQKPVAFFYITEKQRYASFEESLTIMNESEFLDSLSTHSFWIYSYENCNIGFNFKSYSTYNSLNLYKGWNLLGVTKDMVGETLNIIKGSCDFEGIYKWDIEQQKWIEISGNDLIEGMNYGILVKASEDCSLKINIIQPPPFPGE